MTSHSIASRWLRHKFFNKNDVCDEKLEDHLVKHVVEEKSKPVSHGSIEGCIVVPRNNCYGHENLYRDYFADPPVYGDNLFRRRFCMRRVLFLRIQSAVVSYDPYFLRKKNAAGVLGLSLEQKITTTLRVLAYGVSGDSVDEYVRIGESTAIESLKRFVKAIFVVFGDEYLRSPNNNDITRLLSIDEHRGFPEILGSIDCMHWR